MRRDCVAQRLEARPRSPSVVDKNHTLRSRAVNGRNRPIAAVLGPRSRRAVNEATLSPRVSKPLG
jgi:hypothetical protein